jgi:glucuronate isomerase
MKKDLLLYSKTAQKLYDNVKDLPVIDYHCHLNIKEILENKPFETITKLWLEFDHYKWRLMRMAGVNEYYVTGNALDYEKFEKFMEVLSYAIGSPVYHWCKFELSKYFHIEDEIIPVNIRKIYDKANEVILKEKLNPEMVLENSNVEKVYIIEEKADNLEFYEKAKEKGFKTLFAPLLRMDKILLLDKDEIKESVGSLLEKFKAAGCNSADFGIENLSDNDKDSMEKIIFLLEECYKNDFIVQLHFGAMRNMNSAMMNLGRDKGFDSISEKTYLSALGEIFKRIGKIGKTVIFNLNPADNAKIMTFAGNYAGDGIKGKVQMGCAWWFNDNISGITDYFKIFSDMSYLPASIGMLTDSRSLISFTRHDFFRRLLCSYIGNISEKGEFTTEYEILRKIAADISYYNVKDFFNA